MKYLQAAIDNLTPLGEKKNLQEMPDDKDSAMKELIALNKDAEQQMKQIMADGVDVEQKIQKLAMELGPRIEELSALVGGLGESLNEETEESFDYIDDITLEKVNKLLKTVSDEPMLSSPTIGKKSGDIHVWDKKRNHFIITSKLTINQAKK